MRKPFFCHMRTTKTKFSLRIRAVWAAYFVIHCLGSSMPPFSISEMSSLQLVSLAKQACLSLTWLQTPFSRDWTHLITVLMLLMIDAAIRADVERMKKPVEAWITNIVGSTAVRLDGDCLFRECNSGRFWDSNNGEKIRSLSYAPNFEDVAGA